MHNSSVTLSMSSQSVCGALDNKELSTSWSDVPMLSAAMWTLFVHVPKMPVIAFCCCL